MFKAVGLAALTWCAAGVLMVAQNPRSATVDQAGRAAAKLEVLSVSQMAPQDAALLAAHRKDLATAAMFHGYDLSSGTWIASQVACPYAPGYLILHDVQLTPDGSVSLFTALVPRGPGQVRIIPVLHHGAQALHVFGATPGQRSLIDKVISAHLVTEVPDQNGDWATLAYCYGALAGAEPIASSATAPEETVPRLVLDHDGKVQEMSFSVLGPDRFFQDWKIQFDNHGKVKWIGLSARGLNPIETIPQRPLPRARTIREGAPAVAKPIGSPR